MIELQGYCYSVYSWIAHFTLRERGVGYKWVEVDPFADEVPADFLELQPFGRVPVLIHDGFVIYETRAITAYLDQAFHGPQLQPQTPREQARVSQIISIVDNYAYWPLVRQVFSHDYLSRRTGRSVQEGEIRQGMAAAPRILQALENIASGGEFLVGDHLTRADIHLAPMIAYFTKSHRGGELFADYEKLSHWFSTIAHRPSFAETEPNLTDYA